MFVLDIAAGVLDPCRSIICTKRSCSCSRGRGSTQIDVGDGRKRSFEWGPRAAFAIPLNAEYRHFNASGTQRALLAVTTTLPSW